MNRRYENILQTVGNTPIVKLNTLAPEIASCEPGYLRSEKLPHLTTVIRMGEERSPGRDPLDDRAIERAALRPGDGGLWGLTRAGAPCR